jgi:hypothetical protein
VNAAERVCHIAREFGQRGAPSLEALLQASSYRAVREELDAAQIEDILKSKPDLIEDWLHFSEDKRTTYGWSFYPVSDAWVVSQPFPKQGAPVERRHGSASAACADYILTELDFWAAA